MYLSEDGAPQDYKQALYWLTKAAGQGDNDAKCQLGVMCYCGVGVPQDFKQALYWLTSAAEQGNTLSQYNLGVMYCDGYGVPQNYKQAYAWLILASMSGDENIVAYRNNVAEKLTPGGVEEAQKLAVQLQKEIDAKSHVK